MLIRKSGLSDELNLKLINNEDLKGRKETDKGVISYVPTAQYLMDVG